MSKQEREALKTKGDDVDAIPTSDLDRDSMDSEGDEEIREIDYGYFTRNRINLARMFYGKDGGYTIRKLKKFYKNESEVEALQKEEE